MASSTRHAADSHDLIRVQGARVNNLKDISVEIPKRRLTVFTGVSGSGKSSLVFGTIAAESQRLINETYSAFVQGFMPSMARPEVDVLEGLTTAIIVDQERMGANSRSTVGTATDANAMLRVLFSRIGKPHIGSSNAYSFNVPSVRGAGSITVEKGGGRKTKKRRSRHRRHVPAMRGHGIGHATSTCRSSTTTPSRSARARSRCPATRPRAGTSASSTAAGLDPDKPIRKYSQKERDILLYKEGVQAQGREHEPDLRGHRSADEEAFLSKDVDALQPHIREFVERVVTFTTCPDCKGTRLNEAARSSKIGKHQHRRRLRDADQRSGRRGCAVLKEPSVAPLLAKLRHTLDSFVEIGLGYLSLDRPSGTLSGGEAQRTKMVGHLGSSLTDVTYVFDEPTIGLHPHDIQRMNTLLLRLRDKGNTVLVVEHKPEVIAIADHVVDLGPGAGTAGGEVVFEGALDALRKSDTLTGRHFSTTGRRSSRPCGSRPA